MTITAQSIIQEVVESLQDLTSTYWTTPELARYFNAGQRDIAIQRPDACRKYVSLALVAGTRQLQPVDATKQIEVIRNTGGTKKVIRFLPDRTMLDAQLPGWHGLPGVVDIVHYMFDVRDPTAFYVYPPAAATGASVELMYSALPVDIAIPADGSTYTAITGNMGLPDIFANPLRDYILYRARGKDSEAAGNAALAQMHQQAYLSALGIEIKATSMVGPNGGGKTKVPA